MEQKSNEGVKYDEGKLRFDLVPVRPLMELVGVYTEGAKKYDDRNWEKGMSWGRIFGAIMRHLWKWWGGEDYDPESGKLHLAHAGWGCFALIEYHYTKRELDDRPNKQMQILFAHGDRRHFPDGIRVYDVHTKTWITEEEFNATYLPSGEVGKS